MCPGRWALYAPVYEDDIFGWYWYRRNVPKPLLGSNSHTGATAN
jgi:hypothetical protein